jgi:hypothetical protein
MKVKDSIGKALGLSECIVDFDMSEYISEPIPSFFKGCAHTEETKKAISEAFKGIPIGPFSEEHKNNISKAAKGRKVWNKGLDKYDPRVLKNSISRSMVKYSEETKKAFRKPKSEKGKINMSIGQKGKQYPKIHVKFVV